MGMTVGDQLTKFNLLKPYEFVDSEGKSLSNYQPSDGCISIDLSVIPTNEKVELYIYEFNGKDTSIIKYYGSGDLDKIYNIVM